MLKHRVTWVDGKKGPTRRPDPRYPDGIDIIRQGYGPRCEVQLTYPAPRCGHHLIECSVCGIRVVVTAAGRADDPRSVSFPCKPNAVSTPSSTPSSTPVTA